MSAPIKKILLTTDLSEDALRAFEPVLALARTLGASLTLLHFVPDLVVAPHGAPLAAPMHAPNVEVQVTEARKILAEQAAEHFPGLDVQAHVGPSTEVAKDVARYAEEKGFDLIALSSHGRTGFRRMVLGSVAELVLRHSHVPVLCFPRQK